MSSILERVFAVPIVLEGLGRVIGGGGGGRGGMGKVFGYLSFLRCVFGFTGIRFFDRSVGLFTV